MNCEKCNKCQMNCGKTQHRSEKEKKDLIKRLNIIEGQIKGLNQMIQTDRYCDDILIQVAAVDKALKSFGNNVLESHLNNYVSYEIQMGNLEVLEDTMLLIKKLQ